MIPQFVQKIDKLKFNYPTYQNIIEVAYQNNEISNKQIAFFNQLFIYANAYLYEKTKKFLDLVCARHISKLEVLPDYLFTFMSHHRFLFQLDNTHVSTKLEVKENIPIPKKSYPDNYICLTDFFEHVYFIKEVGNQVKFQINDLDFWFEKNNLKVQGEDLLLEKFVFERKISHLL